MQYAVQNCQRRGFVYVHTRPRPNPLIEDHYTTRGLKSQHRRDVFVSAIADKSACTLRCQTSTVTHCLQLGLATSGRISIIIIHLAHRYFACSRWQQHPNSTVARPGLIQKSPSHHHILHVTLPRRVNPGRRSPQQCNRRTRLRSATS